MRPVTFLALCAIAFLLPFAQAREQQELREKVRDGVQRADKDLGNLIHRDKLNPQQREKFDAVMKDLGDIREALASTKWEGERDRFEHAVETIDDLVKHAPITEDDRQTLGIDVYTLQVILDTWKAAPPPKHD